MFVGGLCLCLPRLMGAEPPLVMIQSAPGRFEIAAVDPSLAHGVASAAEEAWRVLAVPLGLPPAFSSPVFVRATPAESAATADRALFRVTVEVGGIVSIRLRSDAATQPVVHHALVQGLLMRLAVAHHGATTRMTSPLWLEHGCVGWWRTRADGAQLDALKQESMRLGPPPLESLLTWRHGAEEPRSHAVGAVWLLIFLQAESGPAREWPEFLRRLLAGEDPLEALAASFPGRFGTAEERELWWQTGYHHARRVRSLPLFDPAESRAQIGALTRFVFAGENGDNDVIVPLREVIVRAGEPVVAAELVRRATELGKLSRALHPFYRNAGLSLSDVFSARAAPAVKRMALTAGFEQDWRDATDLETATTEALDRWQARTPVP